MAHALEVLGQILIDWNDEKYWTTEKNMLLLWNLIIKMVSEILIIVKKCFTKFYEMLTFEAKWVFVDIINQSVFVYIQHRMDVV